MTYRQNVIEFYKNFKPPANLPEGLEIHNPYDNPKRREAIDSFYAKYFNDSRVRIHLLGINPSRLTTTATGVHYTDGYALKEFCGVDNEFSQSRELTADFFYRVVAAMGGAEPFFEQVFPWALMPLTVTFEGNYKNYYEADILDALRDIVIENAKWASQLPKTGRLILLGSGDNQRAFSNLPGSPFGYNDVRILPHPRWIMQYNRGRVDQFVDQYVDALS